jgi:hypothetical protein
VVVSKRSTRGREAFGDEAGDFSDNRMARFGARGRIEFCVSAVGGRLAVTVTVLPKGADMASPAQPSSATYGLEPNARISVYEPVRVDIEWLAESAPPQRTPPAGR